jgi:hypothetical protein
MAVSDIGMVTIAWLQFSIGLMYHTWIYGIFMCKFVIYVQPIMGDSSLWTIAIVSIDRFVYYCSLSAVILLLTMIIHDGVRYMTVMITRMECDGDYRYYFYCFCQCFCS